MADTTISSFLSNDYSSLSLADLLVARDQFHLHLMHKANVIGTAVGKYRVRKTDPRPSAASESRSDNTKRSARTLQNSEVRDYSWPAILVFVSKWEDTWDVNEGDGLALGDFIPPAVYMRNGDKVPMCVILAEACAPESDTAAHLDYPQNLIGGGYPILADVQGVEHVASVGCLVTDGHTTYALTNRHVTGNQGETVYSLLNGNRVAIGTSAGRQLTRLPFQSVYPNWEGEKVYVNIDAGLIEVDDLNRWTTQVYGLGDMGEPADLNFSNLSLRVIGCPVKAYGAASKAMAGEVCALFYRYKAVGGFEYVSDFLIGPREDQPWLGTHHGDSGTLWMVDLGEGRLPSPVALQWGGQPFGDGSKVSSYALATSLSTVCNELEVDLVRGWNTGNPDFWGAVGHYSIANRATEALQNRKLKELMTANLENISYDDGYITKKNMQGLSNRNFVPLADVPDMVWKVGDYKRGGMKSPEHSNHFADMDRAIPAPLPNLEGSDLLEICKETDNVTVELWKKYYDAVEDDSRGLLPFRVQQFFQEMVNFVRNGKVAEFVCAAGIVSHYVGDACQPLHISYLFNGDPDRPVEAIVRDRKTGEKVPGQVSYGTGVHSAYEDDMIDFHTPEVLDGITKRLAHARRLDLFDTNREAAIATVQLMQRTFGAIKPMEIIEAFVKNQDQKPKTRAQTLWEQFGDATLEVMADGCLTLAQVWESAWKAGDGDSNIRDIGKVDEGDLERLYQDPDFMPSRTIDTIGELLDA